MIRNKITLSITKAFVYGFILFAGIIFVTDYPYYFNLEVNPLWGWGITPTLIVGCIGGISFVFSGICLFILQRIYQELRGVRNVL